MPAGNERGDGGNLLSFSHPLMGQPASLQPLTSAAFCDPYTFQPADSLGLAMNQPVDLGAIPPRLSQPVDAFAQVASDLGMSLGTVMPGRATEVEQLPPAAEMQSITQMASNVQYLMNRQGFFVSEDASQQTSSSQYAAAGTSTSASVGSMPA